MPVQTLKLFCCLVNSCLHQYTCHAPVQVVMYFAALLTLGKSQLGLSNLYLCTLTQYGLSFDIANKAQVDKVVFTVQHFFASFFSFLQWRQTDLLQVFYVAFDSCVKHEMNIRSKSKLCSVQHCKTGNQICQRIFLQCSYMHSRALQYKQAPYIMKAL